VGKKSNGKSQIRISDGAFYCLSLQNQAQKFSLPVRRKWHRGPELLQRLAPVSIQADSVSPDERPGMVAFGPLTFPVEAVFEIPALRSETVARPPGLVAEPPAVSLPVDSTGPESLPDHSLFCRSFTVDILTDFGSDGSFLSL
jgi:hypothetical protein